MNLDRPLAEILVEEGLITRDQLGDILGSRTDTTESVGELLVRKNLITQKQMLKCVGLQMGVPFVDLAKMEIDANVAQISPHSLALRLLAIPIEATETAASVAMVNPLDLAAIDELSTVLQLDIDPLLATEEDVRDAIFRCYGAYDDLGEIIGEAIKGVDTEDVRLAQADDEDEKVNVVELKEVVKGRRSSSSPTR